MKLRYYMRGLGIGILVTAILMGVTLDGKTEKLTDEEIIARAQALGMEKKYESMVLSETAPETEPEAVSENEPESGIPKTEEVASEEIVSEEIAPEETGTEMAPEIEVIEETSDEEAETVAEEEPAETLQITVKGGDGSQTVARKLAEAGLVEDAKAYDKYLCNNGYDKRICTGTHTIPVGASEEEIAKIITSRP